MLAASEIWAGHITCQRHWHLPYRANWVLAALESEHEIHLSPRNRKAQDTSVQKEDQPKPNSDPGLWNAPFLNLYFEEMHRHFLSALLFFWQSALLHKSYFTMLLASRVRSILAICNWSVRKPYRQSHMDQSGFKLIPPTEKRWNNEKLLGFISQRQMSGILLWCSLKLTAYCHWTSRIIPINKW